MTVLSVNVVVNRHNYRHSMKALYRGFLGSVTIVTVVTVVCKHILAVTGWGVAAPVRPGGHRPVHDGAIL